MPLPVLTWSTIVDRLISVGTPTYADFLNKVEEHINASTHWRVNAKNLDAVNSRGWIELAPKSGAAGITEGRVLLMRSTGTVAGVAGTERPLQACRLAPWAANTSSLACKTWVGFSSDANSSVSGPANDPWTSATPYGAGGPLWSGLASLNVSVPGAANATLNLIESAEAIALQWIQSSGTDMNGFCFGKIVEAPDGDTSMWGLIGWKTATDSTGETTTGGWNQVATAINLPPLNTAVTNNSAGTGVRAWGLCFKDGALHGIGQSRYETLSSAMVAGGYNSLTAALFQSIVLSGGPYFAGARDDLIGTFRQVRWGPAAYRGQVLSSGGTDQGIYLTYASAGTGAKVGGLWFDNFR